MITLECINANPKKKRKAVTIKTFNSYNFDRNILTPASAFRFTAPGVDKDSRLAIRSGDIVRLTVTNDQNHTAVIGVGLIDETDTHITPTSVDYVITGRDMIGQLVDNDTIDNSHQAIAFKLSNISGIVSLFTKDTRISDQHIIRQLDQVRTFALHTDPGQTRLSALQNVLNWCNGLVWSNNDGRLIVGKPNFAQGVKGSLYVTPSQKTSNVLEARVRRNINQAIRQIVTVQNGTQFAATQIVESTLQNTDKYMKDYIGTNVGRSISRTFNYATGEDTINQGQGVGKGSYAPHTLATEYSARELAHENMKILDVEVVVAGHFNEFGRLYDIDEVYQVTIEDENVAEPMYVYNVSYELSISHGMTTRLRLCRLYTICAYTDALPRVEKKS